MVQSRLSTACRRGAKNRILCGWLSAGGTVSMHMELIIRFDYGSIVPWVRRIEGGICAVAGPDCVLIHADIPLQGEI